MSTLLDPITLLFQDGALFGFLILVVILFVIQFLSKWSFVVSAPISLLMAIMYFKRFTEYPPPLSNDYLIWFGIFFAVLVPIFLLIRKK
jgi:hypothetical protein